MLIKPGLKEFCERSLGRARLPVYGEETAPHLDPAKLFRFFYASTPYAFLLESGNGPASTCRHSFAGASNGCHLWITDGRGYLTEREGAAPRALAPLECLKLLNFEPGAAAQECLTHFWGGWVGYLGYEIAGLFEKLPPAKDADASLPDLFFFQTERLFVYDHKTSALRYIISAPPGVSAAAEWHASAASEIQRIFAAVMENLALVQTLPADGIHQAASANAANGAVSLRTIMSADGYKTIVRRAQEYIADGDIYQANLAQRFATSFTGDPFALYLRLRHINPAPFSAYLRLGGAAVVSSSPERLFRVENETISTRPIAGTRPRGATPDEDQRLGSELLLNEKEKAEHLMLVDLERSDLGRVCCQGSVRVTDFMLLEKYSHVTHIVSNVEGRLLPGSQIVDILRAVFPGGTITGCPKIRCMEIISALEMGRRGLYTGSLGYIGFSRYADLNIIIRTIIVRNGEASFHAGAGIVADSVPEREYEETLAKAAAMIEALASTERNPKPDAR